MQMEFEWVDLHHRPRCLFCKARYIVSDKHLQQAELDFHEQNNRCIKAAGGFKGLTENEKTLTRWKVVAPELLRVRNKFEQQALPDLEDNEEDLHHQEGLSSQVRFQEQVQSLVKVVETKSNPYSEDFPELQLIHEKSLITQYPNH